MGDDGENETAFEMQIAYCVRTQSRKSTVDVWRKTGDPNTERQSRQSKILYF